MVRKKEVNEYQDAIRRHDRAEAEYRRDPSEITRAALNAAARDLLEAREAWLNKVDGGDDRGR